MRSERQRATLASLCRTGELLLRLRAYRLAPPRRRRARHPPPHPLPLALATNTIGRHKRDESHMNELHVALKRMRGQLQPVPCYCAVPVPVCRAEIMSAPVDSLITAETFCKGA